MTRLPAVLSASLLSLSLLLPSGAGAQGLAGPYLAARHAAAESDYRQAADYYRRAALRDPGNPVVVENLIISLVALGDLEEAGPFARALQEGGHGGQISDMVLFALGTLDGTRPLPSMDAAGALFDGLTRGWSQVADGKMTEALTTFDEVTEMQGLAQFGLYHKALALALVGDLEGADEIFSGATGRTLRATRRGVIAHAQVLSNLERNEDAIELIEAAFSSTQDPELNALKARLAAGDTVPIDIVTKASDGVAEVFYSLATALQGEASDGLTLLYSQTAVFLRPGHIDAVLLSAGLLETLEQYDLATSVYNKVPRDHPAFHAAEIGRADALLAADNPDAAIEVLQQLGKSHPDIAVVHTKLGDTLRRLERYDEASQAYDRAIALIDEPNPQHWVVYYTRGITHEREGRWEQAEADFRQALELRPDHPLVLNYLGYSFVEMKTNLDEALEMIRTAVEQRPEDGYITDSLGWVLYRLGRYEEAVPHMERAVALMPLDPIINDHLGDVYWAVDRRREAEFQWRRALSFDPEETDLERIRRKLDVGLDRVLEEEGAEPLAVANDG